jgi:glycosyltransferase involved in cell wall biosynthesis
MPGSFSVRPLLFCEERLAVRRPEVLSAMLRMYQYTGRYDVWQIIGAYPAGYIAQSLSRHVPTVLRSHGQDIQKDESLGYGDRLNPDTERKISRTLQKMHRLVAITPTVRDCFLELGVCSDHIGVIPNGVDLERFQAVQREPAARRAFSVADDEVFILTVGRYHKKKGYEYIPEAVRLLTGRGYNVRWIIIGKGTGVLRPLIRDKELDGRVLLHEHIGVEKTDASHSVSRIPSDGLVRAYRAADIFVLPSLLETFGMVLIEAMAAGVPVVTTDAPGCRDVVRHEKTGLVTPPADSVSLARCIERYITDPAFRDAIIRNAQSSVRRQYEWSRVVESYEQLYEALIQR